MQAEQVKQGLIKIKTKNQLQLYKDEGTPRGSNH